MLSSTNEAMDHGIDDSLNSSHKRTADNSTASIGQDSPETVIGIRSAEASGIGGGEADLNPKGELLGSSKEFDRNLPETVIVIRSAEAAGVSGGKEADLKPKAEVLELKIIATEAEKHSCVIDVKCDEERVCRICHLNSDQTVESNTDLIQLGCGCKDELGIAHSHCAEAWFKLKGNRLCEICGDTAKNITGIGDNRFMDEWNESRYPGSSTSSERAGGCWRGQPFCNFLMACLVIAFVLPWFFRVNMF